jgi:hypothetical protein
LVSSPIRSYRFFKISPALGNEGADPPDCCPKSSQRALSYNQLRLYLIWFFDLDGDPIRLGRVNQELIDSWKLLHLEGI